MVNIKKIQQIMEAKGLNKMQLCVQANISRVTFDRVLDGLVPTLPVLHSLAKCLDVPMASLLSDYDNNTHQSVAIADNGAISAAGNASVNVEADKAELDRLRTEIDFLRQLLDERERTINLLTQMIQK